MVHRFATVTRMAIPTDTIDKLEQIWHSLGELCAGLTEAQWKTPTVLPRWTVQDNLSHLIGTERALQGLPSTEHRTTELDHTRNPIGEANEHEVDVRRSLPGADVLAEWNDIAALRLATLRSADDHYFAVPAMTPTGPGTRADFLHIRVLDCWAHEQDMRHALGIPGNSGSASAAHTIDRLIRTLPIVVGKRAGTPEGDAVRFVLTGPIERTLTYEVREGRAPQVDTPTNAPVATLSMDSDTFACLALGRRPGSELREWVTLEGDTELAGRCLDSLNMMI
jgi:uncharacterized protein (TIGR03083 family)